MSQKKRTRIFTVAGLVSAVLAVMLLASSCVVGDESELIESLLENTNSLGGELTLVTRDGETYTVTISKGETHVTPGDADNDGCGDCDDDCGDCGPGLSDYLPNLNSEKDVFKTLGLWEQVKPMYEAGAAWAAIAGELGYTQETMLQAVRTVIQVDLQEAYDLDLLSQEKYEYKIGYFGELAEKWVKKIFADVTSSPTATLEDFLPAMENEADIFVLLGITDDVQALHDSGYTWADIAGEYGYTADTMYAALKKTIEAGLHEAKVQGLITYDEYKLKLDYYYGLAGNRVEELFADATPTPTVTLEDFLPVMENEADIFTLLGITDDVQAVHDSGRYWADIAEEYGYTADTMYHTLKRTIEAGLHQAKIQGLITYDEYTEKLDYYYSLAGKRVNGIFADTTPTATVTLEDFLPVMDSAADIFVLLGITDDVQAMHDSGYTWADIAGEYGYTSSSMYNSLKQAIEPRLHEAKVQGLITYDEYLVKLEYYYDLAIKWSSDIFAGTV